MYISWHKLNYIFLQINQVAASWWITDYGMMKRKKGFMVFDGLNEVFKWNS